MLGNEQVPQCGGRAGGAEGQRRARARAVGGRVLQLTGESRVGGTSPVPSFLCSVALPTGVPACGSLRLTWAGDVNREVKSKTSQPRGSGGQRSPLPPAGKVRSMCRRRLCSRGLSAVPSVAPPRERRCVQV